MGHVGFSLFALYLLTNSILLLQTQPVITSVRGFFCLSLSVHFYPFHLVLVIARFPSLSLSVLVCSPKRQNQAVRGNWWRQGYVEIEKGMAEEGRLERWGPSGDECNRSRMIMTSEPLLSTVTVSQVEHACTVTSSLVPAYNQLLYSSPHFNNAISCWKSLEGPRTSNNYHVEHQRGCTLIELITPFYDTHILIYTCWDEADLFHILFPQS